MHTVNNIYTLKNYWSYRPEESKLILSSLINYESIGNIYNQLNRLNIMLLLRCNTDFRLSRLLPTGFLNYDWFLYIREMHVEN